MPLTKTPTFSLSGSHTVHSLPLRLTMITASVIELLVKRVWYGIRGMRSADSSDKISPTPPSPVTRLPQEIVEMVIAHLIHDERSLLACSLTCYSWYIASVPHLYHTLVTPLWQWPGEFKPGWPEQLRSMHKLGLLPLVKKYHIRQADRRYYLGFSPKRFNYRTLCHFWALTNVQELGIDFLDIPSFIPSIRRHFKHLFPSVRSLSLRAPKGSHRQVIYFIGQFQHLEDLKLRCGICNFEDEPADNAILIPPFTPPLRGRLTVVGLKKVGLLKEMIDIFGGIRFCYLEIYDVGEMRLLLDACAKTLETLWLYSTDPQGEQLSLRRMQIPANNSAGEYSFQDFNLSCNKSLRTLEIRARFASSAGLLTYALSTITSPAFSTVTIIYWDSDLPRFLSPDEAARETLSHHWH
jgi:hypothetical protein